MRSAAVPVPSTGSRSPGAIARHIATKVQAFTLFATHYFELTTLAREVEGCVNVHLDATEHGEGIVFLHAVKEGPASRSYGLQVAQLAGVPREVIQRARNYLATLEAERDTKKRASAQGELDLFAAPSEVESLPAVSNSPTGETPENTHAAMRPLQDALAALDPDSLSPKAALEALYRLKGLLDESR